MFSCIRIVVVMVAFIALETLITTQITLYTKLSEPSISLDPSVTTEQPHELQNIRSSQHLCYW